MEAGVLEGRHHRVARTEQLPAVGLLDGDAPQAAAAHGIGEGGCGGTQQVGVLGVGEQRLATALDVEDEVAVDEHHHGPRLAAGLVAAALVGRGGVIGRRRVDGAVGPRQGGAERVGGVAGGEHDGHQGLAVVVTGAASDAPDAADTAGAAAQPVDGARGAEL